MQMSVSKERMEATGYKTLRSGTMEHKDINDPVSSVDYEGRPQIPRSPSPVPSCVSMRSDDSMLETPNFSREPDTSSVKASYLLPPLGDGHIDTVEYSGSLQTEHVPHTRTTRDDEHLRSVIVKHKAKLKRRFENISEGIVKSGAETLLSKTYTELYITEGQTEGVNKEHEVWHVELASRMKTTEVTSINCNDIFKPLSGQEKHIRTVMTKGVAGIGKTVSVQKFIIDWTDGIANENVDFMFPLSFRELNLVRGAQYSLHSLLLAFYSELKELKDSEKYTECRVVFILDGLDEHRNSPKLQPNTLVSDVKQISSVDVLIMSLIQGTLFPSALVWITSRPAAASQIPAQYISRVTEIRGFNDQQKEEYFRKKISDKNQANKIIYHIKESRSLHIMCHIPVFCWIAVTVLKQMLEQDSTQEIPKTLSEMFIHFLLIQIVIKTQKYQGSNETDERKILESQKEITLKLAKLAFKNLENGNVMFYEEDLKECDIDVSEASVFSGICTEIFKEETLFQQKKVYCFVHLSIQEFLAALHVFVSYSYQMETIEMFFCLEKSLVLLVTKVLESRNGHLDLFLRFLLGILLEKNQRLLLGLLEHTHNTSKSISETCQYIKELNREDLSPERCINLFHCLLEVNDQSISEDVQNFLKSQDNFKDKLSPAHCSALAHILLMSEEDVDDFHLKKYNASDEGRRRLIPAVRCCRKARLDACKLNKTHCETVKKCLRSSNSLIHLVLSCNALEDSGVQILSTGLSSPHCNLQTLRLDDCKLSGESCKSVATVLQSPNSLIELDLSHNDLGDSGVQILSKGLAGSNCKLQILRLSGCLISEEGCGFLNSALISNPSHLKELDLSYNHPGESGRKLLSARRMDPKCKLETLNMEHCAEIRIQPGVQKYVCELTLDLDTADRNLSLSEGNRKVTYVDEEQPYPDHPDRFDSWYQVLCREGLSGRCYWEAEWNGREADIAVAYKSIRRKGGDYDTQLGRNDNSWNLHCSPDNYIAWHNNVRIDIPAPSSDSSRVGVYLDWPAGTLSFYRISSNTLTHLHTFYSIFTEPLYPGFWVTPNSPVSLCQITLGSVMKKQSASRRVLENHKAKLKKRFEDGSELGAGRLYTEICITEGESKRLNVQRELWQLELASRTPITEEINCNDIFKPFTGHEKHIRTVVTKGVAGIGKTVSVQKFILDWTEGVANQDVDFMFLLPFHELNLVINDQYSLHKLLLNFHSELKEMGDGEEYKDCQVVFIFDGLDKSQLTLNFQHNPVLSDVKQESSVDALMTSLIQGTLFPSALIWITSQTAAAKQIPAQYIDRVTELNGFNDPQKEEYFRKRISDQSLANRIISHIMARRSLRITCHIPVFCWITATVFQQMLEQNNDQELPKTVTEMFIHFLLIQTTQKHYMYKSSSNKNEEKGQESYRDVILKISKLAFRNLENVNVRFHEEDLMGHGIDLSKESYSDICANILKEESLPQGRKTYCFFHRSIQEFLAALNVFVSYSYQNESMETFFCLEESLEHVVNKVLESKKGHLDLFLYFLMGISLETNQILLQGLIKRITGSPESIRKTCQYIKEHSREGLSPERWISVLQCLSEVNDNCTYEEIQDYQKSTRIYEERLTPAHCSALAHVLLMSEEVLNDFDPRKYNASDEGRRRLIPALRRCRKAHLSGCKLNKMSYETVVTSLQSANSLIHLDLSRNDLGYSGVQILSEGLTSSHSKLQTIRFTGCNLSDKTCEIVGSVLQAPNSLIELDLSHNDLGDSGVQLLSDGLTKPNCTLERLRLSGCLISEVGCICLASALTLNPSHLKELDLSYNHPGESGLNQLSARLKDPICKLEILNTDYCGKCRLRPGVQKYGCELTLDPTTAQKNLSLSEGNKKVMGVREEQPYPDHPDRFERWYQVLCREGLSGCCYWEVVKSEARAHIIMAYKSIRRKGGGEDSNFGSNEKSWTLFCSPDSYSVRHNNKRIDIPVPSSGSRRVGVYLDWQAGTLSFYSVSPDTLIHLHTFHSTFTEPLYPGFWIPLGSSVTLCQIT